MAAGIRKLQNKNSSIGDGFICSLSISNMTQKTLLNQLSMTHSAPLQSAFSRELWASSAQYLTVRHSLRAKPTISSTVYHQEPGNQDDSSWNLWVNDPPVAFSELCSSTPPVSLAYDKHMATCSILVATALFSTYSMDGFILIKVQG